MNTMTAFDFESFCKANPDKDVNHYDYLRAVYQSVGLSGDFLFSFLGLLWPDFLVIDGRIFVAELFSQDRYEGLLNNGQSHKQAHFWANLLEVTGLFDELPEEQARAIAEKIAEGWTTKIRRDFGPDQEGARVIYDNETDEIFVVIGSPD